MICPKCNVKIPKNSGYCIRCGTIFKVTDASFHPNEVEEQLMEIYFKEGKIRLNFFNISVGYLLFNFSYAFYKKMYYEGIIGLIATTLLFEMLIYGVGIFLQSMGFYLLLVHFTLIATIYVNCHYIHSFNDLYLKNIRSRVRKIIISNPDDEERQKELCKKDSKGNIFIALVSILVFLVIILFPVIRNLLG